MVESLPLYGTRFYQNPLRDGAGEVHTNPDPYILKFQGRYYCYATDYHGIKVSVSRNLVQWDSLGYAVQEEGRKNYWAPCVVFNGGKFYLYYSNTPVEAPETQNEWLRMAVGNKPEGPFRYEKTLFKKFSVDAEVVKDKESNYYLFYSTLDVTDSALENTGSSILVDRLPSFDEVAGEPQAVVLPTLEEEMLDWVSVEEAQDWSIVEGATYAEHHEKAYLIYSANIYASENYYIGYALADKDGPVHQLKWEKYPNNYTYYPLVKASQHVEGTGHTALIKAPNNVDFWLFYHGQETGGTWSPEEDHRTLRMDRLFFDGDALMTYAPSANEQPAPGLPDLQEFFEGETKLVVESGEHTVLDKGWLTAKTPFIALYDKEYQYYHLELDLTAKPANLGSKDGAVIAYRSEHDYTSVYLRNGTSVLAVEQVKNGIHSILATFPLKDFDATVNQHLEVIRRFADYELYLNGVYIGRVLLDEQPARVGICSGYTTTVFHYFAVTETIDLFGLQMRLIGNFFSSDVPVLINTLNQLASFRKDPVTLTTELKKDYQYSLTYTLPNEESKVICRLQLGAEKIDIHLEPTRITIPSLQLQHSFPLAKNDKSAATFIVVDQMAILLFKNETYQFPIPSGQNDISCRFVLKKAALDAWELVKLAQLSET